MIGTPSSARPWYSIGAMRPVSNTTRVHAGQPPSAAAIASGDEAAVACAATAPSRSRRRCPVLQRHIQASEVSMVGLLFDTGADLSASMKAARPLPHVKKWAVGIS